MLIRKKVYLVLFTIGLPGLYIERGANWGWDWESEMDWGACVVPTRSSAEEVALRYWPIGTWKKKRLKKVCFKFFCYHHLDGFELQLLEILF